MIKVAALTSGKKTPSTRYRIRQHISSLAKRGIEVREYLPWIDKDKGVPGWPHNARQRLMAAILPIYAGWQLGKMAALVPGIISSRMCQITWISRHLFPGYPTLEFLLKKPIILDVDDAVWLMPPCGTNSAAALARRSEMVMVGNRFLAEWYRQYSSNVHIVPTAVDAEHYVPAQAGKRDANRFVVGWIGSSGNLPNVESIATVLAKFLQNNKESHFLYVSDRPGHFPGLSSNQVTFIPWSEENEVSCLQKMDVGLMPLADTDLNRGKCAFKMLQYMACGLPVIVSPVGVNSEILELGELGFAAWHFEEWMDALTLFNKERDIGHRMGLIGRNVILKYYDRKIIVEKIADIIRKVATG